jgi:hypothetical protein
MPHRSIEEVSATGLERADVASWHMVEIIGLVAMSALIWLLAWAMATESAAERRRLQTSPETAFSAHAATGARHAA